MQHTANPKDCGDVCGQKVLRTLLLQTIIAFRQKSERQERKEYSNNGNREAAMMQDSEEAGEGAFGIHLSIFEHWLRSKDADWIRNFRKKRLKMSVFRIISEEINTFGRCPHNW
jgi:hypothetical protein